MYQLLDTGFIGVIFSYFSEDAQKVGRIQVIAFQALDGKHKQLSRIPVQVAPVNVVTSLESESARSTLGSTISGSVQPEVIELDPINPKASVVAAKVVGTTQIALDEFFAHADGESSGRRDKMGSESATAYHNGNLISTIGDLVSMDLTARMQEAMHRSNLDLSGAEHARKEVPLQVLPGHSLAKVEFPLSSFVDLQHILFKEEQAAYNQAMSQSVRKGKVHPLTAIHHSSTYEASMCKLMEYCLSPVLSSLWDRLEEDRLRLALLQEEVASLELEVFNKGNVNVQTSRRASNSSLKGSVYAGFSEPKSSFDAPANMKNSSATEGSAYQYIEGESNSDESDSECRAYQSSRIELLQTAEQIFSDAAEEFSQLAIVEEKFEG